MKLYPLIAKNENRIAAGGLPKKRRALYARLLSLQRLWWREGSSIVEIRRGCRETDAEKLILPMLSVGNGCVSPLQDRIFDILFKSA